VSGFGDHQVHYDHMWKRQGKLIAIDSNAVSNVKELFPDNS
jgi:hypothetical protein